MSKAAVAGVAALPIVRKLPMSLRDAATQVALDALEQAGFGKEDVDGLFCTPPGLSGPPGFMWSCSFAEHLGVDTKRQFMIECGGMTAALAFRAAVDEIRAGRIQCAVIVALDQRAQDVATDFEFFMKSMTEALVGLYGPFDGAYGLSQPIPYYSMSAQRYMYEYKATPADLAEVAVVLRNYAVKNARAQYREPITVDDVLSSKFICPPLRLLDCSPFAAGAAAAVVCNADLAKAAKTKPVWVTGMGEYHQGVHFTSPRLPITRFESAVRAAGDAYREAGKNPGDIDVAEVYGVFTATELMLYEDMGFFEKGHAFKAVKDGKTSGKGTTVFNPCGGRLSLGHPAGATPLYSVVEIVEQLRGEAGAQIDGAKVGLVHAEHGMLNGSLVAIMEAAS